MNDDPVMVEDDDDLEHDVPDGTGEAPHPQRGMKPVDDDPTIDLEWIDQVD